jgi:Ecdysteroid kinase-like family
VEDARASPAATVHRLVVKFAPTDPEVRPTSLSSSPLQSTVSHSIHTSPGLQASQAAARLGSFRREVGFYNALGSKSSSASSASRDAASSAAPLPVAPCIFAAHAGNAACVLLKCLAGQGFAAGDQVAGATLPLATRVMTDLGEHHATFWQRPELTTAWTAWLPCLSSPEFLDYDATSFAASWPRFRTRFPGAVAELSPVLRDALDGGAFLPGAKRLLHQLGTGPLTLLHGDLRLDNVMHRATQAMSSSRDAAGIKAAYIDMGDCAAGRGAFDVAYFLSMSLDTQLRRQAEDKLLHAYADRLQRSSGGVGGAAHGRPIAYSSGELHTDYGAATTYALCLAVNLGGSPHLDTAPERKRRLAAAMATRACAAVADARGETFL